MTIEEFERQVEILNGKSEWFLINYGSEYKSKYILIETKTDTFDVSCETWQEGFDAMLSVLSVKESKDV